MNRPTYNKRFDEQILLLLIRHKSQTLTVRPMRYHKINLQIFIVE